jgi:hypothetical protein
VQFNGFSITGTSDGDYVGVTSTGFDGGGDNAPIPDSFLGQNYYGWGDSNGDCDCSVTTLTFTSPITSFAFDWFNTDYSDQYEVTLSDGTVFTAPPFDVATYGTTSGFFGVTTDSPITSATISADFDGGYTSDEGIDNVQTSVPEPASMMLLGAALLGLGAVRRQRRS